MKKIINTTSAPAAIGPYSQAVVVENIVYTSGMIGIIAETGEVADGLEKQTEQALSNLKNLLEASGSSMDQIIKTTIFIKDMNFFATINEIYSSFFKSEFPARSCVEVARLPKDVYIEIEAIAIIK